MGKSKTDLFLSIILSCVHMTTSVSLIKDFCFTIFLLQFDFTVCPYAVLSHNCSTVEYFKVVYTILVFFIVVGSTADSLHQLYLNMN